MKVVICGSRDWDDDALIAARVAKLRRGTLVITGGQRGADTIAHHEARTRGLATLILDADWERYKRAAGPLRNKQMLDHQPTLVIAFHDQLYRSRGTKNCVAQAQARGIQVEHISHKATRYL